jgi:hypothetical protein
MSYHFDVCHITLIVKHSIDLQNFTDWPTDFVQIITICEFNLL